MPRALMVGRTGCPRQWNIISALVITLKGRELGRDLWPSMDIPFIAIGDILHVGRHPLSLPLRLHPISLGGKVWLMSRGFSFNLNLQIQICVYGGIIFDIILAIPIHTYGLRYHLSDSYTYISTYVLTRKFSFYSHHHSHLHQAHAFLYNQLSECNCIEGANFEQSYDFLWNLVLVKLDCGHVNCGTIILWGCWLLWQNEI